MSRLTRLALISTGLSSTIYALPPVVHQRDLGDPEPTESSPGQRQSSFDSTVTYIIAFAIFFVLTSLAGLLYYFTYKRFQHQATLPPILCSSSGKVVVKVSKLQISKPLPDASLSWNSLDQDTGPGFGFNGLSKSVLQDLREKEISGTKGTKGSLNATKKWEPERSVT